MNPFARLRAWLNKPVLEKLDTIMSQLSDYSARVNTHLDAIDASIAGVAADVADAAAQIAALQASAGTVTAEDQALLDATETRLAGATSKLAALDALTPPKA